MASLARDEFGRIGLLKLLLAGYLIQMLKRVPTFVGICNEPQAFAT